MLTVQVACAVGLLVSCACCCIAVSLDWCVRKWQTCHMVEIKCELCFSLWTPPTHFLGVSTHQECLLVLYLWDGRTCTNKTRLPRNSSSSKACQFHPRVGLVSSVQFSRQLEFRFQQASAVAERGRVGEGGWVEWWQTASGERSVFSTGVGGLAYGRFRSALHSAAPTVPVCLGVVFSKQPCVSSAVSCHVTRHQSQTRSHWSSSL